MTHDIAIVGGGPSGLALAAICEQKGLDYIVFERSKKDVPPSGGCLDLHPGSGQRAVKEAGCFEEFKKRSRGGDATELKIFNHHGTRVAVFGAGRDSPEIDRHDIRKMFMTVIPEGKVQWEKKLKNATRDTSGQIVLSFTDGTKETGFRLVVGADGVHSKVRHLVTDAKPDYAGCLYLSGAFSPRNPLYEQVREWCGQGTMCLMGNGYNMFGSLQGTGDYRIEIGFEGPQDFAASGVDLKDEDAVRKWLLRPEAFGSWTPKFQDLIRLAEGPFSLWTMYYMPTDRLNWSAQDDVTLIGDAAHVTTPFVGDGVNCAMRDSVILATILKERGINREAIAAYEREMFPYAIDVITRSQMSGNMFFEKENPKSFAAMITGDALIVGVREYE